MIELVDLERASRVSKGKYNSFGASSRFRSNEVSIVGIVGQRHV